MKKNEIRQTGAGNLAFADIHDSTFNIIISRSTQYQDLVEQLETEEALLLRLGKDERDERLRVSRKISQIKQAIEDFKADVLRLAEQFNRVPIDTERLRRTKQLFESGKFVAARTLLEAELSQLRDEQTRLLAKRNEFETDILPKLRNNAEQFLILALFSQLDHSRREWFDDSVRYFEDSIRSYATKHNVFEFAVFCWRHNRIAEAQKHYEKFLTDFAFELSLAEKAGALNNLGLLHWDSNEFPKGLSECTEALGIYKKLSEGEPSEYLVEIAGALTNSAMLRSELNEESKALQEYEEALAIYRRLCETRSKNYSFDVAKLLNNLGAANTYRGQHSLALAQLQESLAIFKRLSTKLPADCQFFIATCSHNLGILHSRMGDYRRALKAYRRALDIRMREAVENPAVYLPEAACTLSNLASFHVDQIMDRKKSIRYAVETIAVLIPIYEAVPFTQRYLEIALRVLKQWNLSVSEINNLVEEKIAKDQQSDASASRRPPPEVPIDVETQPK